MSQSDESIPNPYTFADTCRHLNGFAREECAKGITLLSVRFAPRKGEPTYRFPCFRQDGISQICPHCDYPTEAEVIEEAASVQRHQKYYVTIREAILSDAGHVPGHDPKRAEGIIPCSVCGEGTVAYRIFHNCKIRAKCSTKGCVSWLK